jgi:hypothetical protein
MSAYWNAFRMDVAVGPGTPLRRPLPRNACLHRGDDPAISDRTVIQNHRLHQQALHVVQYIGPSRHEVQLGVLPASIGLLRSKGSYSEETTAAGRWS